MPKYAISFRIIEQRQVIIESDKGPPVYTKDGFVHIDTKENGVVLVLPSADLIRCDLVKDEPRIVAPGQPQ